jgi:uncharacterized protein YbjT (DUF2867 family)
MPVIVVGADTPLGEAVIDALLPRPAEVRAFVTSPEAVGKLRARGVKVALGDVSDGSHVGGAALNAFCAVLIGEAAVDNRERSFASDPTSVVAAWVDGLNDAAVSRAIFVGERPPAEVVAKLKAEAAHVPLGDRAAAEVARLEDLATLPANARL